MIHRASQLPSVQSSIDCLSPKEYAEIAHDFLIKHSISINKAQSLEPLGEVLQAFLKIPYENLSKILKFNTKHQDTIAIRMPDEVWSDFRNYKLGGTCFSLTYFLQTIVEYLGYNSYPVMAHMRAGENHHCALVVLWQGEHYLADPGYVLDLPMRLTRNNAMRYRNAHTGVEICPTAHPNEYELYTFTNEKRVWRYKFQDIAVSADEFFKHWTHSFSWNGMNGLCLSRNERDALVYVHNFHMRETTIRGKKNINLKKNRAVLINQAFGIPEHIIKKAENALLDNRERKIAGEKDG